MKKEEILEASRKENKEKDLQENEIVIKACSYIAVAIAILAFAFFALEIAFKGTQNYGFYSFICVYNAILFGYKGIKLHKKTEIWAGILWTVATIVSIVGYVFSLI